MNGEQLTFPAPIEGELWTPTEWITTTGRITWLPWDKKDPCEDCIRCLVQDVRGKRPDGTRPAGLIRRAVLQRTQQRKRLLFCLGHGTLRQIKEQNQ